MLVEVFDNEKKQAHRCFLWVHALGAGIQQFSVVLCALLAYVVKWSLDTGYD
jgi:hypothetical protein